MHLAILLAMLVGTFPQKKPAAAKPAASKPDFGTPTFVTRGGNKWIIKQGSKVTEKKDKLPLPSARQRAIDATKEVKYVGAGIAAVGIIASFAF